MNLAEELYVYVAKKVLGKTEFEYQGQKINLKKPWKRVKMVDAIKQKAGIETIQKNVLEKFGSTGVQECLDTVVFKLLEYFPVFPAGTKGLIDSSGRTLADCFLMPKGSKAIDFAYTFSDKVRFRVNIFLQMGYVSMALRLINSKIRTIEDLNLPLTIKRFAQAEHGLVLITGSSSQGKSTTLASLIVLLNIPVSFMAIFLEKSSHMPLRNLFLKFYQVLQVYRDNQLVIYFSLLLSTLNHTVIIITSIMVGKVIGADLSWRFYGVITPMGLIASALPIAPAGLGIGEAAFEYLYQQVGSAMGGEIIALLHLMMIFWGLVGLPFYLLTKKSPAPSTEQPGFMKWKAFYEK